MSDMDVLIARLEAATVGSRELDCRIFEALGFLDGEYGASGQIISFARSPSGNYDVNTTDGYRHTDALRAPNYTASVGAALALRPKWASFELTESAAGPPTFTRCRLWDWRRGSTMSDPGNEWKSEGNRPLPLNICIAALRARAA